VREQAEQPLDARPGAAQVLGRVRLVERLARGDQQLFVGCEKDGLGARTGCTQRSCSGQRSQGAFANARVVPQYFDARAPGTPPPPSRPVKQPSPSSKGKRWRPSSTSRRPAPGGCAPSRAARTETIRHSRAAGSGQHPRSGWCRRPGPGAASPRFGAFFMFGAYPPSMDAVLAAVATT
jgi:hypothetical protein